MALDPVSFNALAVIRAALGDLGVTDLESGEQPSAAQAADALDRLNAMIASWSIHHLAIPVITREVFDTVASQGSYTVGVGGDFDTVRPTWLTGSGLLLMSSSPPVEIPRGIMTEDAYEAIPIKDLESGLWTNVYYRPTYAGGLGQIHLWPVPNVSTNKCVLYRGVGVTGFTNLTTAAQFPPGYFEAFQYNLAKRLAIPYGKPATEDIVGMARESLFAIKRQNTRMVDLAVDPGLTMGQTGGYNIQTGEGG